MLKMRVEVIQMTIMCVISVSYMHVVEILKITIVNCLIRMNISETWFLIFIILHACLHSSKIHLETTG